VQIQEPALQRVRSGQFRADGIAAIFEHMGKMVAELGPTCAEFTIGYQSPDEPVAEGDMVPVIILQLRPAVIPPPKPPVSP